MNPDQNREGAAVAKTRMKQATRDSQEVHGALEVLIYFLDRHPDPGAESSVIQIMETRGWEVVNRTEAAHTLRVMVASAVKTRRSSPSISSRIGMAT